MKLSYLRHPALLPGPVEQPVVGPVINQPDAVVAGGYQGPHVLLGLIVVWGFAVGFYYGVAQRQGAQMQVVVSRAWWVCV